jgi:hypothetical protein
MSKEDRRTHCRKCGKSCCQLCCQNFLVLSKTDRTEYKCCDFCASDIENLTFKNEIKSMTDRFRIETQEAQDRGKEAEDGIGQKMPLILEIQSKL